MSQLSSDVIIRHLEQYKYILRSSDIQKHNILILLSYGTI